MWVFDSTLSVRFSVVAVLRQFHWADRIEEL
jgi:hypothetical protein